MGLSRRNTIIGLGALAGGAGTLAASGAFTTVEAERDVSINTVGDDEALLQIEVNDAGFNGLSDGGGDTIELNFDDINRNARTTFAGALEVTPTGSTDQEPWEIDILDALDGDSLVDSGEVIDFSVNDDGVTDLSNVGSDDTVIFDIALDLLGLTEDSEIDQAVEDLLGDPNTIAIEASQP